MCRNLRRFLLACTVDPVHLSIGKGETKTKYITCSFPEGVGDWNWFLNTELTAGVEAARGPEDVNDSKNQTNRISGHQGLYPPKLFSK